MEHTKGEWKRRKECQITYFIELGNSEGNIAVFTDKPERTEEVARLIATAPDLKAVVEDMLSGLSYLRKTKNIPYGFGIDRLEKNGKAALAKAGKE